MAEFFFSVPGAVTVIGLGILLLSQRGGARRATRTPQLRPEDQVRRVMQIVVSFLILGAGLWVLLSGRYGAEAMHWAAGATGTVMGYWLK